MPTETIWLPKWASSVWPFTMTTLPSQISVLFLILNDSPISVISVSFIHTHKPILQMSCFGLLTSFQCSKAPTLVHITTSKHSNNSLPVNLCFCLSCSLHTTSHLQKSEGASHWVSHRLAAFLYIMLSNGIWSLNDLVITELYKPYCLTYKGICWRRRRY